MTRGITTPEAERWLVRHLSFETEVMRRARERCEKEGLPVVPPETGGALRALAATRGAGARMLEVGCLYGYSALCLLAGAPRDATIESIEIEDAHARAAEAHFREAGVGERARVLRGAALDVLPTLRGPFDLVFLDAVKAEYPRYLEHALRVAKPGALILADNALWSGRVWDASARDADTEGLRAYTTAVAADARLATTILPIGDGLAVSVVR